MKRLTIGQWVEVTATVAFGYNDDDRKMFIEPCRPWRGQICGAVYRRVGKYDPGGGTVFSMGDPEGREPATLCVTGTKMVYRVRGGVTNKAADVLPEHLTPIATNAMLPWRLTGGAKP